jgi:Putative adhesin
MRRAASCLILLLAGALSARAETQIERTLKIDSGGRLEVDTGMGAITVTGTSRPDVHVVVTSKGRNLDELLALRFEEGGKTARITGRNKVGRLFNLFNWWDSSQVQFQIEVPSSTVLNLATAGGEIVVASLHAGMTLRSSGGALDLRDLVGDVDGHTSGGGVRLKSIKGRVHVTTSGGSIDGSDLDGAVDGNTSGGGITLRRVTGDLRVHSSGGEIHIDDVGGTIDASTSGGGIEASFARGNSRGGRLESSGGSIYVSLDSKADLEIDAVADSIKTTNLLLQLRGGLSHSRLQGTLGKGGQTLRIHTSGGGIRIASI